MGSQEVMGMARLQPVGVEATCGPISTSKWSISLGESATPPGAVTVRCPSAERQDETAYSWPCLS